MEKDLVTVKISKLLLDSNLNFVIQEEEVKRLLEEKVQEKLRNLENGGDTLGQPPNEGSQSEWSEDEEGGASEPLLNDRESTGYTTDDPALENISMIHETGLTDAEGKS